MFINYFQYSRCQLFSEKHH